MTILIKGIEMPAKSEKSIFVVFGDGTVIDRDSKNVGKAFEIPMTPPGFLDDPQDFINLVKEKDASRRLIASITASRITLDLIEAWQYGVEKFDESDRWQKKDLMKHVDAFCRYLEAFLLRFDKED